MKTKEQRKDEAFEKYLKLKKPSYNQYKKIRSLYFSKYLNKCDEIDNEPETKEGGMKWRKVENKCEYCGK